MAQDEPALWYRWRPEFAESAAYADIAEAVERFEPVANEAGYAAAEWLKQSSLDDYPSTATWLIYHRQRIEGYFAICSAEVKLYGRQRKKHLERGQEREHELHPAQPASLITWLGKHAEADISGRVLIRQAAFVAREVAEWQGNIALVLDPYNEETAELWLERYSFFRSGKPGRLWLPLHEEEEELD
jgi:hypothetical protein